MLDWVVDNTEFAVGTALALLGVYLALRPRPNRLDYDVLLSAPLLSSHAKGTDLALTVAYNNMPLEDLHLFRVRIRNSGKSPITSDAYADPIEVRLAKGLIWDILVSDSRPAGIVDRETEIAPDAHRVQLTPRLLNSGDWFDLQLLIEGDPKEVEVSARFAGQTRTMRNVTGERNDPFIGLSVALTAIFLAAYLGSSVVQPDSEWSTAFLFAAVWALGMGYKGVSSGIRLAIGDFLHRRSLKA